MFALFATLETWVAGGTAPVPTPYLVSLWTPLVEENAARYGIPPQLDLGLIAHESGGDWLAAGEDPNGTVDAGLQQVNSSHWAAYGMQRDPYDPPTNVSAGLNILAAALNEYPGDLQGALEAYNGFGSGYAAAVLGEVAGIDRGPQVFAWPVEARIARGLLGFLGGGQYLAPASAGPRRAYLIAAALCPCGDLYTWDGMNWTPLRLPQQVTVGYRAPGQGRAPPQPMALPGTAPGDLQLVTPPGSRYFWTTVPIQPDAATDVTVTATWRYLVGHGKHHRPVTVTARTTVAVQENHP